MEVPIKTIQLPLSKKRGRSTAALKDNAPSKRLRIPRTTSSKSVNLSQPQVGRHPKMDEHPKPGSKSTRINGAPKFWSWDIGTPWLHMGNDSESKRVNIFTCYIDFKNWINHLKTTNYRDIYSLKIALHLTRSRPKSPRQSVFTLKFGQTKRWQLRRLLLLNDEKYYRSNIFPHRVSLQKQGGE